MIDKKAIIRKIESLPDADLKKISEFLSSLEERPDARNCRANALSRVVGICDGPQDLAEKHDSYQAPLTVCTANNPSLPGVEGAPARPARLFARGTPAEDSQRQTHGLRSAKPGRSDIGAERAD